MLKVAITGSKGLIGSRIKELLRQEIAFTELELPDFDITNRKHAINLIKDIDFDLFFHLAAYTNIDQAEKEKEKAYLINVQGTKNVFDAVVEKKRKFIFVSTDFVFDGQHHPFYEESVPKPLSYYAKTKYEAEKLIKKQAMIVRFSYPYRAKHPSKPDFVKRICQDLEQKRQIYLITDSLMTPTFIDDIAFAMKYLFENFSTDIFHIVGTDSLSPYDAGKFIANAFNLDQTLLLKTSYLAYSKDKAIRPQYSEIKSRKNNFYKMRTFTEGISEIKKQTMDVRS